MSDVKIKYRIEEYRDGKRARWEVHDTSRTEKPIIFGTSDILEITQFVLSLPYDFEMVKKW